MGHGGKGGAFCSVVHRRPRAEQPEQRSRLGWKGVDRPSSKSGFVPQLCPGQDVGQVTGKQDEGGPSCSPGLLQMHRNILGSGSRADPGMPRCRKSFCAK